MIVLGLAAFYTRNQGVSAITGGFLQILVTTTGRGSLEDVIAKGIGAMGGYENVSEELEETMIGFGELIEATVLTTGVWKCQILVSVHLRSVQKARRHLHMRTTMQISEQVWPQASESPRTKGQWCYELGSE